MQQNLWSRSKECNASLYLEWPNVFNNSNFSERRTNNCHHNIIFLQDEGCVQLFEISL